MNRRSIARRSALAAVLVGTPGAWAQQQPQQPPAPTPAATQVAPPTSEPSRTVLVVPAPAAQGALPPGDRMAGPGTAAGDQGRAAPRTSHDFIDTRITLSLIHI